MKLSFTLPRAINVHSHLRGFDDPVRLAQLAEHAYNGGMGTVLPMPNLVPPIVTGQAAVDYMQAIQKAMPGIRIIPTLMMTEITTPDEVREAARLGVRDAKIYPRNRTTNSADGGRNYMSMLDAIKAAGEVGMRIHFHPEYPAPEMMGRDAEYLFAPVVDMFLHTTNTIFVWEHGTDGRCVRLWDVFARTGRFFVTLTAHHLAEHEDGAFGDAASTCKPSIKTHDDRAALVALVMSNKSWVMLGLDDAPHTMGAKHPECGKCACGAYTAPFGLQLAAHALDEMLQTPDGPEIFRNFVSRNASNLYGLSEHTGQVTLIREEFTIPPIYTAGDWRIPSFWGGKNLLWSLVT